VGERHPIHARGIREGVVGVAIERGVETVVRGRGEGDRESFSRSAGAVTVKSDWPRYSSLIVPVGVSVSIVCCPRRKRPMLGLSSLLLLENGFGRVSEDYESPAAAWSPVSFVSSDLAGFAVVSELGSEPSGAGAFSSFSDCSVLTDEGDSTRTVSIQSRHRSSMERTYLLQC
jgi:hypothetical protein